MPLAFFFDAHNVPLGPRCPAVCPHPPSQQPDTPDPLPDRPLWSPPPRAFHSAVRLGQSMLVVGGGVWQARAAWALDLQDWAKPRWREVPLGAHPPPPLLLMTPMPGATIITPPSSCSDPQAGFNQVPQWRNPIIFPPSLLTLLVPENSHRSFFLVGV